MSEVARSSQRPGGRTGRSHDARAGAALFGHARVGLVGATVIAAWLSLAEPLTAQVRVMVPVPNPALAPRVNGPGAGDNRPKLTIPVPRELMQALEDAQELLAQEQYPAAVRRLQFVLESPEDYFPGPVSEGSLKTRAVRLLRGLPPAGREAYELVAGTAAKGEWERPQRTLEQRRQAVLRSYGETQLGRDIARQWAVEATDTGRPLAAAMTWQDLREWRERSATALEPAAVVQEALAWSRVGRLDRVISTIQTAWPRLDRRWDGTLGDRSREWPVAANEAGPWLQREFPQAMQPLTLWTLDWAGPHGTANRNGRALAAGTMGGLAWTVSTLGEFDPASDRKPRSQVLQRRLDSLIDDRQDGWQSLMPTTIPVGWGDRAVFRTLSGLEAVDLRNGQRLWRSATIAPNLARLWARVPDEIDEDDDDEDPLYLLLEEFKERLYDNGPLAQLVTNGELVFAIEAALEPLVPRRTNVNRLPIETRPPSNFLQAFSLATGKLRWELGGPSGDQELTAAGVTFLGPPLVDGADLYALVEEGQVVRLLHWRLPGASPPSGWQQTGSPSSSRLPGGNGGDGVRTAGEGLPELVWAQSLAGPPGQLAQSPLRRRSGLTPILADGLLICPTGAGLVVAVDPLRQRLVWASEYTSVEAPVFDFRGNVLPANGAERRMAQWFDGPGCYARGTALLTLADFADLLAIDVHSGQVRWRRTRHSGLTVAGVVDDIVVLVNRAEVIGLNLETGEEVWSQPLAIPTPTGRGLLVQDRLLLPVISGEILTIHVRDGRLLARWSLPDGERPGNLVAAQGRLLIQESRRLRAFGSVLELHQQMAERLARDPADPLALAWRGELRLNNGDLGGAITDLRQAAAKSHPAAQSLLTKALTEGLRIDFAQYRATIPEIERAPIDESLRREFLFQAAQGFEQTGERLAAFERYLQLADLPHRGDGLLHSEGGRIVRREDFLAAHLRSVAESASPAEQAAIDGVLTRWSGRQAVPDAAADERILKLLGFRPEADRLRRQKLAEADDLSDTEAHRLALELRQSQSVEDRGFATMQLAQRSLAQRPVSRSRPWLDELASTFKAVRVGENSDGQPLTGAEWLAAHPEALRRQSLPVPRWAAVDYEPRRSEVRGVGMMVKSLDVEVVGPIPAAYRGWAWAIDILSGNLVCRDTSSAEQYRVPLNPSGQSFGFRQDPRIVDRNFVAPKLFLSEAAFVLSYSDRCLVIDIAAAPKVLRTLSLGLPGTQGPPEYGMMAREMEVTPVGRRRVSSVYLNSRRPGGQVLGVNNRAVFLQIAGKLQALDLIDGQVIWSREGLPTDVEGSVDDAVVVVADRTRHRVLVFRTSDGEQLAEQQVAPPGQWVKLEGRRLVQIVPDTGAERPQQRLECLDLLRQNLRWSRVIPALEGSVQIAGEQVLILDSRPGANTGLALTACRWDDGRELWSTTLPAAATQGFFWADADDERFYLAYGSTPPSTVEDRTAPLDVTTQTEFAGRVAAVDRSSGRVLWSRELSKTGLGWLQSPWVPVWWFAARADRVLPNTGRRQQLLELTCLDRRTGDLLYRTQETPPVPYVFWDFAPGTPVLRLNCGGFLLDFEPALRGLGPNAGTPSAQAGTPVEGAAAPVTKSANSTPSAPSPVTP